MEANIFIGLFYLKNMNRINFQQSARELFESHPQKIKTLDFALIAVYFSDLKRGADERGLAIRNKVYLVGEYGYLALTLSPLSGPYNERLPFEDEPFLQTYPTSQAVFIEQARQNEHTAAFFAMDIPSLEVIFGNEAFDQRYLKCHMGVYKRHVRS